MTPAEKHRYSLEAELLGPNAVRLPGFSVGGLTVERGSGSVFSRLPESARRRIELADDLIAAEKAESSAAEELHAATVKHNGAVAALRKAQAAAGYSDAAA
jgi:hypothetical protein